MDKGIYTYIYLYFDNDGLSIRDYFVAARVLIIL